MVKNIQENNNLSLQNEFDLEIYKKDPVEDTNTEPDITIHVKTKDNNIGVFLKLEIAEAVSKFYEQDTVYLRDTVEGEQRNSFYGTFGLEKI